jgi:hypothetical protein
MKKHFSGPLTDTQVSLMTQAGFVLHCVESGRTCYHRQISDDVFPRFHALVDSINGGVQIDLHFDQFNIHKKGNHKDAWAYEGERVHSEMMRITSVLEGLKTKRTVNRPNSPIETKSISKSKKKTLFEILFR